MEEFLKPKVAPLVIISLVFLIIIYSSVSRMNNLKNEYKLQINFVVAKRIDNANGTCELYDYKRKRIPIKTYFFTIDETYIGDSIVKKANSNLIYVYRKKNWSDEKYYIAEKLDLDWNN
jgi:hypothetical protein